MISKKSVAFQMWVRRAFGVESGVADMKLLTELELAARLAVHDLDTMGEITPMSLHNLARASKNLEAAYENKPG